MVEKGRRSRRGDRAFDGGFKGEWEGLKRRREPAGG